MSDTDKLNELIHFMKGAEPFSKTFADLTRTRRRWCPFSHGNGVDSQCYHANESVKALLDWTARYVTCCRYLDINRYSIDSMSVTFAKLQTPETMSNFDDFQTLINDLASQIKFIEPELRDKLSRLECRECMRLDEALVCFENYCFRSAIVMAVSAVEYRIVELIRRSDEKLYLQHFSKATLGQLIDVFNEDRYKNEEYGQIKSLMPAKHKPLISLLNQYRVFSAHPKDEEVTPQIAEAVLHLAFAFMTDPGTCPYSLEELSCRG